MAHSWVCSLVGGRASGDRRVNALVDKLLDDKRTRVIVTCDRDDTNRIIGWLAFARIPGARIVEGIHVRRQRRGEGLAKRMLEHADMRGAVIHLYEGRGAYMAPEEFLR